MIDGECASGVESSNVVGEESHSTVCAVGVMLPLRSKGGLGIVPISDGGRLVGEDRDWQRWNPWREAAVT